jgi:hypothetical protein
LRFEVPTQERELQVLHDSACLKIKRGALNDEKISPSPHLALSPTLHVFIITPEIPDKYKNRTWGRILCSPEADRNHIHSITHNSVLTAN